ncbi:MAG: leucyl aminopeptidase [Desulfuromonas sp.]|nr:leucyl aminopeptidase [Desulfuromonas sp.]
MKNKITLHCATTWTEAVDCRIVAMTEECWQSLPVVPTATPEHDLLLRAREDGEFSAKSQETLLLHCGTDLAPRLLVVGLGAAAKLSAEVYRQAAALAVSSLRQKKLTRWLIDCDTFCSDDVAALADALADGVLLEAYRFDHYKKEDNGNNKAMQCVLGAIDESVLAEVEQRIAQRRIISEGVWLCRNLVNEPGNVKTPVYLAEQAWALAELYGLTCTLLGPEELQRQGFGALLAVAKGSICEPRLIVLDYQGASEDVPPIALVGKGVTFDSGGISLKPGEGMDQMKMDMAGGAAVLATLAVAAQLKLPLNIVGVVPAVENMPSDRATRPGDIVTSLSGKTIEILNTDAEGRLILADALTWVARRKPQLVVDLATLTGACIIALGHQSSAVLGNDEALIADLRRSGDQVGERVWPLPLFDEYSEQIKSEVADVKNIGGRPAGTITAAAFLQKFVEDLPWAHLDIAGTAWQDKGKPGQPNGGTGVGVRLLIDFLRQRSELKK